MKEMVEAITGNPRFTSMMCKVCGAPESATFEGAIQALCDNCLKPLQPVKKQLHIISLDIESSGREWQKHALLSIGIVDSKGAEFYVELKHLSLEIEPQAMRVNQMPISQIDIDSKEPPRFTPKKADAEMLAWLNERLGPKDQGIPMGLNIGSFDMPFVRRWLPRAAARLSYRTMDLNALMFNRSLQTGEDFFTLKHRLKVTANLYAQEKVPLLVQHNALFDAHSNWGMLNEYNRK